MRIISHSCSNTEILCALGCADYLVGVDDHSDFPEKVIQQLPKVGPDLGVDPDKVNSLKPDLIIASDTVPGHDRVIAKLKKTGIPMLVTAPRSLEDIASDMIKIASALGIPKRGERLAAEFLEQLALNTVSHPITRPKVLIEWWPKPVIVPGRQSWASQLIHLAGGTNPLADDNCQSREVSSEEACSINPDIIVISWCGVPTKNYRPQIVTRRPDWQSINAVKHNRVIPVSEAFLGRPGPRLIDGLRILKRICQTMAE